MTHAAINDKVVELIRDRLEEDPTVSTAQLREEAEELAPDLSALSLRQFHARYVLQVKRKIGEEGGPQDDEPDVEPPEARGGGMDPDSLRARRDGPSAAQRSAFGGEGGQERTGSGDQPGLFG